MWDSGNKLQNHAVAVTRFMLCAREEASYKSVSLWRWQLTVLLLYRIMLDVLLEQLKISLNKLLLPQLQVLPNHQGMKCSIFELISTE